LHVIKKSARESLLLEHGVDRSGFGNREDHVCYTTQLIVRAFVSQQQSTDDVIYQKHQLKGKHGPQGYCFSL